jgi:hypothetical protein
MGVDDSITRAAAILDEWHEPTTPGAVLAYRPLAEAVTGVACPQPIEPDEVERRVAVARRNREYSAAHTDAMLPGDPPILPGLLARAEALDARERAVFAGRLAEHERRAALEPGTVAAADLRLATVLRERVRALEPRQAAVLCLRHGLAGDRPRRPDEVARTLGVDPEAARHHEADALAVLRATDAAAAVRDVLDTGVRPSPAAYPWRRHRHRHRREDRE